MSKWFSSRWITGMGWGAQKTTIPCCTSKRIHFSPNKFFLGLSGSCKSKDRKEQDQERIRCRKCQFREKSKARGKKQRSKNAGRDWTLIFKVRFLWCAAPLDPMPPLLLLTGSRELMKYVLGQMHCMLEARQSQNAKGGR